MPTKKVKGGYKWGSKGKVYKNKADADKQGRAIKASQSKKKKGPATPAKKKPAPKRKPKKMPGGR